MLISNEGQDISTLLNISVQERIDLDPLIDSFGDLKTRGEFWSAQKEQWRDHTHEFPNTLVFLEALAQNQLLGSDDSDILYEKLKNEALVLMHDEACWKVSDEAQPERKGNFMTTYDLLYLSEEDPDAARQRFEQNYQEYVFEDRWFTYHNIGFSFMVSQMSYSIYLARTGNAEKAKKIIEENRKIPGMYNEDKAVWTGDIYSSILQHHFHQSADQHTEVPTGFDLEMQSGDGSPMPSLLEVIFLLETEGVELAKEYYARVRGTFYQERSDTWSSVYWGEEGSNFSHNRITTGAQIFDYYVRAKIAKAEWMSKMSANNASHSRPAELKF